MVVPSATIVFPDTSINTFINGFFQSIQYHICKSGRDDTTLWGSCLCRKKFVLVNNPSFKPLGDNLFVDQDVISDPVMTDIIEASRDVTFQYGCCAVVSWEMNVTSFNGVMTTSLRRKPYEEKSAVVSDTGSRAERNRACMALSFIVGIPRGLFLPFFLLI